MYRPTLRRKLPYDQPTLQQPIFQLQQQKNTVEPSIRSHFHNFSIPTKFVSPPINNKKQPVHLISPLLVQSHTYPPTVKKYISTIEEGDHTDRGIGVYREINWFFKGKIIIVWITDSSKLMEINLDDQINCMTIGELKERCLPSKLKRNYLIAVGSKDNVELLSLNPYTLESKSEGFRYHVQNSLQISKIKFIQDNKILVGGCTGAVELIQLGSQLLRRKTLFPFYRRFVPVSLNTSKKSIKQMLYTPKRIFVFIEQNCSKNWFKMQLDTLFTDEPKSQYTTTRSIVVYDIRADHLAQSKTIFQKEIQKKLKSVVPNWSTQSQIASIYLDSTNDKDGQLGIVTKDGCFLVMKNNQSNYISKEPIFIPKTEEIGSCEFLQQKKLDPLKSTYEQLRKKQKKLVKYSLGYQNLTLITDGLFWVGDQRIDGVLATDQVVQIFDKNQQAYLNLVQQNREWGLYTLNSNYYTLRQQPLRSFVGLLIYIRGNLNDDYEGFHYREQKFKEFIQKQIKKLKPQRFLRYLIEIVILKENGVSVNDFMMELIDNEMKEQKAKDFRGWNHSLTREVKKKQLLLTQDMFKYIWSLILELQYKQTISVDIQDKSFSSTNVYWLAMHSIYYSLISPLLELDHLGFKNNKKQVQQTYLLLKSLQSFIQKKEKFENTIRSISTAKRDAFGSYNDFQSTQVTNSSQIDVLGITNEAKNIVLSKVFHEKYNILQQKIKIAISSTIVLMSIYFNLEGFIQLSEIEYLKLQVNTFKNILIQKESQRKLKKLIVAKTSFDSLQELKTKIPFFNIQEDLAYKRCFSKIEMEKKPKNEIDLNQLANSIYSEYFEDVDQLFGERMDLKFKMLELYYEKIQHEQQKLAKEHAQYSRNNLRKEIFPDDEEQLLKQKRYYLQRETENILAQQKKCIKKAIQTQDQQKKKNKYGYSFIMDQIIISIRGNIVLLDYMQAQLRKHDLVKQCNQVQKIKHRFYVGQKRGQIKDPFHREIIPKELFPNRREF